MTFIYIYSIKIYISVSVEDFQTTTVSINSTIILGGVSVNRWVCLAKV